MKKQTSPKHQDLQPTINDLRSSLARALADYANLERRFSEQSSAVIKFATSDLLTKLLDVRDHLALATTQIKDPSLSMILSSLDKLLIEEGVVEVKTDGLYDPTSMECQEMGEGEKDKIIKVVRPGYRLHDKVLRTARVVVGSGTPAAKGYSLTGDLAEGQVGTPKAEGVSL
jgi:molecular chaperone GrpE